MKSSRREFINAATGAGLSALFLTMGDNETPRNSAQASPVAPDPNDPNDPNAITDPDHEIGKPYVGWREGELDLNFISTGVGENMFYIFPDGTTMLLDAGDWTIYRDGNHTPAVPNDSRRPGEWIARYISRAKPGIETIDYVMASHFHSDHTGEKDAGLRMKGLDGDADYMISGISHVGEFYRFDTAFDRGYPTYDQPTTWAPEERENLVKYWEYAEKTQDLKREEFIVGALDQIKMKRDPDKYDFHIRNLSRNGVVWGGEGKGNVDYFALNPENKSQTNENTRSISLVMNYGAFRFYTGGDASGALKDAEGRDADFEGAIGRACGPVDVCKANHHSFRDAMRKSFINAVQARAYVVCVWTMAHLQESTAAAMCDDTATGYQGPRLMCPTQVHSNNAEMLKDKPWRGRLVERGGHVVVKAYDGGARYKIYYLTHDDESMKVELVFGPFESKSGTDRA
ncbi:MAG: MBL fold metallo-hydrolase [Thermoguttaceae bacterium]|nr:MBL fold metallo-hydrolase [Thermoguttaceae bacterium]